MGTVQEHIPIPDPQQFETARPDRAGVPGPPVGVGDRGDPGRLERVEGRIRDRRIGRLMASAKAHPGPSQAWQVDLDRVAVPAEQRGGRDLGQGDAQPPRAPTDDRQPVTARARHGQVPALDDGCLLAGDLRDRIAQTVHVIEVHVRDHGHATVPDVCRVEPSAEPDLDQGDVRADLLEPGEGDGREQLELGRLAVATRDPIGDVQDQSDQPGEVVRRDRPAVQTDPLPIGHEVRFRCGPHAIAGGLQRRPDQRQHAALAVRPADQRATDGPLRVVQFVQECAGAPESEPDTESATLTQRPQGLSVGETGRWLGHRWPVTRESVRPHRTRID